MDTGRPFAPALAAMPNLEVRIETDDQAARTVCIERFPCRIGKARDAEVCLGGWRVGRLHAEIQWVGRGLKLVDLGTLGGTTVNGERVVEFGPLSERDEIGIAGYRLRLHGRALRGQPTLHAPAIAGPARIAKLGPSFVANASTEGSGAVAAARNDPGVTPATPGLAASASAAASASVSPASAAPTAVAAVAAAVSAGWPTAAASLAESAAAVPGVSANESGQHERSPANRAWQRQLALLPWRRLAHRRLLEVIDLQRRNLSHFSAEQLRDEVSQAVEAIVFEMDELPPGITAAELIAEVVDEAVGLGPIERLMAEPDITEIMVNGAADVFVERGGRLQRAAVAFSDELAVRNIIERIVTPLGRRIDEASPLVDARLPDGSRVNAIIAPVALKGPTITIRRFNRRLLSPADLVRLGTVTAPMMAFLEICVRERRSIVVSGGTGSGKTTLLNVLSNLIGEDERLITIEDAAELKLVHEHLVALESRPPNAEGRGAVTIRDLVRNALRMRPDRIIVGECRGGEALDMLQAMNTGHEGSLTTVHANTPRDALSRLEVMSLMSGVELPLAAIRDQIANAVDVIVHQARLRDGSRRITSLIEITGVESGRIQSQELFRFEQSSSAGGRIVGRHIATGAVPEFYEDLRQRGLDPPLSIFAGGPAIEPPP
jgi:pilus assembly protein CpaF